MPGEHACLVKFGALNHILELHREGLLYMNKLPFFWQAEDGQLRQDENECLDRLAGGKRTEIEGLGAVEGQRTLRLPPPDADMINLFCMYALRPAAGTFPVDSRNLRFGASALVVTSLREFIDRVAAGLQREGIRHEAGLVEYVDDDYHGKIGPLKKLKAFAYQSEWRVVCYDGPGCPREVRIGNLEDISFVIPSGDINGIGVCF